MCFVLHVRVSMVPSWYTQDVPSTTLDVTVRCPQKPNYQLLTRWNKCWNHRIIISSCFRSLDRHTTDYTTTFSRCRHTTHHTNDNDIFYLFFYYFIYFYVSFIIIYVVSYLYVRSAFRLPPLIMSIFIHSIHSFIHSFRSIHLWDIITG